MIKTLGTALAGGLTAAVIAALMPQPDLAAGEAASCESLLSLRLSDTTIALARLVPAGEFSRPVAIGPSSAEQAFSNPVAFCRVAASLKPSSDFDRGMATPQVRQTPDTLTIPPPSRSGIQKS